MEPRAFDKLIQWKRNVRNNDKQKRKTRTGAGGERQVCSSTMELLGAHFIDLMHAASFASFRKVIGDEWKEPVVTK